jgi:hypothetical protein
MYFLIYAVVWPPPQKKTVAEGETAKIDIIFTSSPYPSFTNLHSNLLPHPFSPPLMIDQQAVCSKAGAIS